MDAPRIVRFARTAPVPWKNGLGKTTELAIHPRGAGGYDFEWRVSIARLEASAPFSSFSGVERCLAVLQGEMTLVRPSHRQPMTPDSPPVRFDGHEAVEGQVMRGPVLDLNVMCRASRWRADMRRIRWSAPAVLAIAAPSVLCSLSNGLDIEMGGVPGTLDLYDAVVLEQDAALNIGGLQPAGAWLIELRHI